MRALRRKLDVLDRALGFGLPFAILFVAGIAWRYQNDADWRETTESLLARLDDGPKAPESTVDLTGIAVEQVAERTHLSPG